ncbi:MAG: glycosyltransferase [Chloroflexi bacterium]|nr:glycosyltransferase [Chloroflexota bacterium]
MRLLFLTPQFPYPPHKGTTLRNYNLIAGLAARHEIDLLSVHDSPQTPRGTPLDRLCRRIAVVTVPARSNLRRAIDTLISPWPDMGLRLWAPQFLAQLQAWLSDGNYDAIEIEGIELARYGLALTPALSRRGSQLIFDDHNAEYLLQARIAQTERAARGWTPGAIYSTLQARKLRRFERRITRQADRVVAVSDADAAALRELDPALRVHVVPNGIDTALYDRSQVAPIDLPPHSLVFTGTMDFRPNVDAVLWFAREVLPLIKREVPDAQFVIVGQRPHARLAELRSDDSIVITGGVEDTRPYITGASVYVVPLRMGGGTRFKLLEALALHAPCVSTTLGAEGFEVVSGRELLLADDAAAFARATVELIRGPEQGRALGVVGRSFAEKYDWRYIVPKLEQFIMHSS